MSKYIPDNHKHLTAPDRLYIKRQLNSGSSFKDIVRYLCKEPSTISKEVRSHRLSDLYPGRGRLIGHPMSATDVIKGMHAARFPISTTMTLSLRTADIVKL